MTRLVSFAVVVAYDFSRVSRIVDVGGGHGALLKAILTVKRNLKGVIFDSSSVIEEAIRHNNGNGLAARCELVAGDFFQSVPSGGDTYIMKNILHDWDDRHCTSILNNCRSAMAENGRVLLVETVVTPGGPSFDR